MKEVLRKDNNVYIIKERLFLPALPSVSLDTPKFLKIV